MSRDPGFYDYLPYDRRPVIRWPDGARVAFWVAPNVEFYELDPPRNPARAAEPRPAPDVLNYSGGKLVLIDCWRILSPERFEPFAQYLARGAGLPQERRPI